MNKLPSVFRVCEEPYKYHSDADVHSALVADPSAYFDFVLSELTNISSGHNQIEAMPLKQIFTDPGDAGDYRVMPCSIRSGADVRKSVKLIGTNLAQKIVDQISVGKVFLLHPVENFITDIYEACILSSARTGMCAAQGIFQLQSDSKSLGIIGSGRVGWYSALYAASKCPSIRNVYFNDIRPERAVEAAKLLSHHMPSLKVAAVDKSGLKNVDAVVLATEAKDPILSPMDTRADLIVSLGADCEAQSELSSDWSKSALFVDVIDSAHIGDLHKWQKKKLVKVDNLVDLFTLISKGPGNIRGRRKVFISTGSALFDNMTVGYLAGQKVGMLNSSQAA